MKSRRYAKPASKPFLRTRACLRPRMPLNPAWMTVAATRTRVPYHQRVASMTSSRHAETARAVAASNTRKEKSSPVSAKRATADSCIRATVRLVSFTLSIASAFRRIASTETVASRTRNESIKRSIFVFTAADASTRLYASRLRREGFLPSGSANASGSTRTPSALNEPCSTALGGGGGGSSFLKSYVKYSGRSFTEK